jgi:hypothetical protein
MNEKIHIHIIDGTDVWIPIDTIKLNENEFEVLKFEDFDPEDIFNSSIHSRRHRDTKIDNKKQWNILGGRYTNQAIKSS